MASKALGLLDRIPDFDEVSAKLKALTGWTLVAVPGLIPAEPFFDHLANRRFPVTNWLRTKDELDYIVEPDMFHDFFGHVPALTQLPLPTSCRCMAQPPKGSLPPAAAIWSRGCTGTPPNMA
jgi:phenylalanine-4-hydroxylase